MPRSNGAGINFDPLPVDAFCNSGATDDWLPIDAPGEPPPTHELRHPKHGAAIDSWVYRTSAGIPICAIARFDLEEGLKPKKLFSPFSYGQSKGLVGWHMKGPSVPRPLFGLDRLAARPESPVLITEGEKSADAASAIFPDMVAVASMNGSGSADKADWAPLRGRHVVIWPDNDPPGAGYAQEVQRQLKRVGVTDVGVVKVPNSWPDGWDVADAPPEDVSLEELREYADNALHNITRRGLYLLTPRQCALEPIRPYVVKGLLSRGDHGALIGLPGSAKSALAPYIGYRTALGLDVFGHRTKATPVLYLAAEDGSGMKQRVRALYERMGDAPNFYLQPVPVDFLNSASSDIGAVEKLILQIRPGLIILDTIARAFPGLKENDPDAMGAVVRVARNFTSHCDSAVLSIHHPPKDNETPRGHSVLNGDLDVTLILEGTGSNTRSLKMGKNRSGPSDLTFSFALSIHTLEGATDEDGEPITAPVAEPLINPGRQGNSAREAKLKDSPALLLREARGLIEDRGEMLCPGADYPSVRAVTRESLRSRLIDRAWFAENLLLKEAESKIRLQREGYKAEWNGLNSLKRKGLLSFNNVYVWLL